MFRIRLVLVREESRWIFRIGSTFRVVNAVTAVALLAAGFVLGTFTVPVLLACVAALACIYEESAVFDLKAERAEFRLGLLFLHRTRVVALDQIAEVRVVSFGQAKFTGLEIGMKDGRVFTVENDRGKPSHERLTAWGTELAAWLGVPLTS